MPNDTATLFDYMIEREREALAWKNALDCEAWIWKCIRNRNVPDEDQYDVFQTCLIEVYRLMLRYDPTYSKVAWANFGVLKGLKKYDCTSGLIRLPSHVVEKVQKLHVKQLEAEAEGTTLSEDQMREITGMKILDVLTAQEKFNRPKHPEDDVNYFMEMHPDKCDSVHFSMLNGNRESIIDQIDRNVKLEHVYNALHNLEDIEIFVLYFRFGLDENRIPYRPSLFEDGSHFNIFQIRPGGYNLQEIGNLIALSKERIRQIENGAVYKIQNPPYKKPQVCNQTQGKKEF